MKRILRLRSETLAELTGAELASVAGGESPTYRCTDYCYSVYECPIPTLPLRDCIRPE